MTAQSVRERPAAPEWDSDLAALGGTIFHARVWADYEIASSPTVAPRYLEVAAPGGGVEALALGLEARGRSALVRPLVRRMRFDALPARRAPDDEALDRALAALESFARRAGCVEIEVGSFASPGGNAALRRRGFETNGRFEFEIALGQGDEALLFTMDHSRRKNIAKAARAGVTVRDLEGADGVRELRRLQAASSRRIVARGGPDISVSGDADADPVNVLIRSGHARVVGAILDGRCVSAGLFTVWNGLAYFTLSGHDDAGLKAQAPTLMLWETMRNLREAGVSRLNLGGCGAASIDPSSPEHGVFAYKKGFGGRTLECASGTKTLRKGLAAARDLLRGLTPS